MKINVIVFVLATTTTFIGSSVAMGDNCTSVGQFTVGSATAANKAANMGLKQAMVDYLEDTESMALSNKIQQQISGSSCASITLQTPDAVNSVVIQIIQPGSQKYLANVNFSFNGKQTMGTSAESSSIIGVLHETTQAITWSMIEHNHQVVAAAINQNGLSADAGRVTKSLITMDQTTGGQFLVLEANGLRPSLFSPGFFAPGKINTDSEKIVSAVIFLNGKGKAFVDHNLGGPKIVDLATFQAPENGFLDGYDLMQDLMNAMKTDGYTYQPSWK